MEQYLKSYNVVYQCKYQFVWFLGLVKNTEEQLNISARVRSIALHVFRKLIGPLKLKPVSPLPHFDH